MRKSLKNRAIFQLAKISPIVKFQLAKIGSNLRNPQSSNLQVHYSTCKSTSKHTCAILQVQFQVSQLVNQVAKRGNLRTNLRIQANLRKCQPMFKFIFKPLIFSIFISHSPFKLWNNPISCEAPKIPELETQRSCVWRKTTMRAQHPPCGTQASLFQPWPRQEEPTPHLHQLAIQGQELHLRGFHIWGSIGLSHSTLWVWSAI